MEVELIRFDPGKLATELPQWQHTWEKAQNGQPFSYFLSWPWISHWLHHLPAEVELYRAQICSSSGSAICFLGHSQQRRWRIIHSDSYHLHYCGCAPYDNLTLEYNQIPVQQPDPAMITALLEALPESWDELHLPALDARTFPGNCLPRILSGYKVLIHDRVPSYRVDLREVGTSVEEYLKHLSTNTRGQIHRAMKKLKRRGELKLEVASSLTEGLTIYDDLMFMHQQYWNQRGLPGAFSADWFIDFHRSLIHERFASGELQLIRVLCGGKTIGCLYNFLHQGNVLYYQSGFDYPQFGDCRPGFVCHALAIAFNAAAGHQSYDFLAGNSQYKKSLGTNANEMIWCTIQKPRLRFYLENLARDCKTLLRTRKNVWRIGGKK